MEEYSYRDLSRLSARFANVLRGLGLAKGERVYALTGRIPELYIAALGTWKAQGVFCTLPECALTWVRFRSESISRSFFQCWPPYPAMPIMTRVSA